MSNKYPGGIITSGANAGYSVAFDGTANSYLTVPDNTAFDIGAGDFVVECWVYLTASTDFGVLLGQWGIPRGYALRQRSGKFQFTYVTSAAPSTEVTLDGTTSYALNTWYYVAAVRTSNTLGLFVNGTREASASMSGVTINNSTDVFSVARAGNAADYTTGYISNARVIKGTVPSAYSATATSMVVPTQLLNVTNTSILTCNSPALVDQSSNSFTITSSSGAKVSTFTPFTGTQLVPNPNTLANTQGVWSISDAAYWMSQNKWPMPPNYPLQSLRFNSADSANLSWTPASAGNRRIWTWSGWVKRSGISTEQVLFGCYTATDVYTVIRFQSGATLQINQDNGTGIQWNLVTTPVYRDVSAWYHIVLAVDTTQATSTDRVKLYINGTQVTAFTTSSYPSQNFDTQINRAQPHIIGFMTASGYFSGYMSNITFVDGQALTPSSFGANDPNTGVWSPVPYSGTYGTNGFRLSFQDNTGTTATTLGKDYSGNGNNWTPNNFSVAAGSGNDSLTDGPTNWGIDYGNGGEVRGNYATLNPLATVSSLSSITVANGNLQLDYTRAGGQSAFGKATIALPSSGKFYYEMNIISASSTPSNAPAFDAGLVSATAFSVSSTGGLLRTIYLYDGTKFDGTTYSTYGAAFAAGDVVNIAVDMDNGRIYFGKNGSWANGSGSFNQSFGGATAAFTDLISSGYTWNPGTWISGGTAGSYYFNFGQRPFAYPAPSGFKVLCTTNLPIPTVGATSTTLAGKYFNPVLYTGNSSTQTITGVGFQPDFTWIKVRSISGQHVLFDAVRGGTNQLFSSSTNAEQTDANMTNGFASDGFLVGNNSTGTGSTNQTGQTYVAWNWNAGGSTVTNTSGSISSQVRANTTAGVSVVTFTAPASGNITVGHGLGVTPAMVIVKSRSNGVANWYVWHRSLSSATNSYLELNNTIAAASISTMWGASGANSTTLGFTTGNSIIANATEVAYCFAEIAGFSKFGSYTGNGSTDGPFIYCGFRPRWVMVKQTSAVNDWMMYDTARSPYNIANLSLYANLSNAEATETNNPFDIVSNGFKLRGSGTTANANGGTYIFMAFAESPFNYSRAR